MNIYQEHEFVDLGLPSGTLWATCNIGANKPEEYGDCFAWGEIKQKTIYDWDTYKYSKVKQTLFKEVVLLTKYCDKTVYGYEGFTDELTVLQSADDPATNNWGNGWCMPSKEQWKELIKHTSNTWTTRNDVHGWLFRANNGNSLFLPGRDFRKGTGGFGYYWSSLLCTYNPRYAWLFYFNSEEYYGIDYGMDHNLRYLGHSVRPVRSACQN